MQPKPISFIPTDVFKESLTGYEANYFVSYLVNLFGVELTNNLISRYFIGTSKRWDGATTFWQVDLGGEIRTGKIMLYSPSTGKRVKMPFNHIDWVHNGVKLDEFGLKQCLFGEHLLVDRTKPIAIVESEKTAIIASVYLPDFIWLACGQLQGLSEEKCRVLAGRDVVLFPDLKAFEKWQMKAVELSSIATFTVSSYLEHNASEDEKSEGLDIADYLVKYDWQEFVKPQASIIELHRELTTASEEFVRGELSSDEYGSISGRINRDLILLNADLREFIRMGY
ncbi:hypothetical protein DN068_21710 [Taibaiella soli]|uniref:DUF6371 domain-containing protein n=2 Tax=Taibaiella soli TaxID=1649169 RepID=A0A2W2A6C2_9BACT|nr:hypothetical protein DN068_21710 [Taibaiella soli]